MNLKKYKSKSFIPARYWYLFCILGGILLACTGPVFGASAPDITALSPDSVHAGFSHLVTLSGQGFTDNMTIGFRQDDNALNVTDMKFISDEKVTFRVITPSDAKPGFYQMILSSPVFGEQKYNQVFHVRPPAAPELENITPSSAMAGTTVEVHLTGKYFRSGCTAFLTHETSRINLSSLSVRYDQVDGEIILSADATPGIWNLSVINPDGQEAESSQAFTITALPKPQILAITPDRGDKDTPVQVTITGSNFINGTVFALSRNDLIISGTGIVVDTPGRITGTVLIPQKYHEGLWDLTITNPDGQYATKASAFLGGEPYTPFNLQISPSWGIQGTEREVTLRGMSFLEGDHVTLQKGEKTISAKNVTIQSETRINCIILIPESSDTGSWDVVVTNRYGKSDIIRDGFTIYSKTSLLLAGIEPDNGEQGQFIAATITGNNLVNGSLVSLTNGKKSIQSESASLVSPGGMKALFHIPADAMPDKYDLVITFPSGQRLEKPGAFRVFYNNTPVITSIVPDRAPAGAEDIKVTVFGRNFGNGEYLNLNLTYNATDDMITIPILSAVSYQGTRITGYLSIPNGTLPRWYDLDITRDAGRGRSSSKEEAFRVL
ncbi:hypothetical protein [Methanospirillum sp.]|uniref:hypothetical protein n=2 Tax=Methanospirillum sp. TaxID=45200 RepID=UPI001BD58F7A|nr:hypothetical protein [Methanospirillum sp.]